MSRAALRASVWAGTLVVCWPLAASAQWQPPLGIPTPSFGITQTAPPRPNPWSSQVPGYYYVDRTHPNGTDSNNTYGTPSRPRRTIPFTLPAGSVVELHGTYDFRHTSPDGLLLNGTVSSPVYIRGESPTNRPIITQPWSLRGSYFIVENIESAFTDSGGRIILLAPLHHAAVRFSDLHGNLNGGGMSLSTNGQETLSDIVIYANSIHDNGNVLATFDQDVHGIKVGERTSNLWVVDNVFYRNSGNGIQISAGNLEDEATLHHVYVGRNVAHHNRQAGFTSKQGRDIIFSQNTSYAHRPLPSGPQGACMIFQYAPERIWFLFNHAFDCDFGIYVGNDNGEGTGQNSYFIGNVIRSIHASDGGFNPGTAYGNAAMMLAGGTNRYIVNNTIHDVDGGINSPGAGALHMSNNIISTVTQPSSSHVFVERSSTAAASTLRNSLFQGTVRLKWGGNSPVYNLGSFQSNFPGQCQGCLNANPMFTNAPAGDLTIQANSPAVDAGIADSVYNTFQSLYGIDIRRDFNGIARPVGPAFDIGAYEIQPSVSVLDHAQGEGNFGTTVHSVPLSLNGASPQVILVSYSVTAGTATAGVDFVAATGTVAIPPLVTSYSIPVTVLGDLTDEPTETYNVTITSVTNALMGDGQAVGSVTDDDAPPEVVVEDCGVVEGNAGTTTCTFRVSLSAVSAFPVSVGYATQSVTAVAGQDFTTASGTITFPPGSAAAQNVPVTVVGDAAVEPDEGFRLSFPNLQNATAPDPGDALILDDDAPVLSTNEVLHGWIQAGDLASTGAPDVDYYRIAQQARTSWEVVVDEVSGDIAPGLVLERLASDNSTVLQSASPVGTGPARSMRWEHTSAVDAVRQTLRVRSAGCTTDCGADDGYRIRLYETTMTLPRFNNANNSVTVVIVQNPNVSLSVSGNLWFWSGSGALLYSRAFTLPPLGVFTLSPVQAAPLLGVVGSATLTSNAPYGALAVKAVTIDSGGGFSFDAPFEPKLK